MSLKKIYWKQGHNFIQIFYCSTSFHVSGCSPFQLHVSCLILSCQIFKLNIQPNNLSILLKMLLCFKRPFHNAPLKSWLNCYFNIGVKWHTLPSVPCLQNHLPGNIVLQHQASCYSYRVGKELDRAGIFPSVDTTHLHIVHSLCLLCVPA